MLALAKPTKIELKNVTNFQAKASGEPETNTRRTKKKKKKKKKIILSHDFDIGTNNKLFII